MARQQKVTIGELNIRLHPHVDGTYDEFIDALYRLKMSVKLRGTRYGIISMLDRRGRSADEYIGIITTFTKIPSGGVWFDTGSLQKASEEQVSEINIPQGLSPDSAAFYFRFNPQKHRLIVQSFGAGEPFSIGHALRLFSTLADRAKIVNRFGRATITIVQKKSAIDDLFGISVIRKVTIVIEKPNADVFADDFEESVEDYLIETNSRRLTLVQDADRGESVKPSVSLKKIAMTALANGHVIVEGRNNDAPIKLSSDKFPISETAFFDPDQSDEKSTFLELARSHG